MGMHGLLTMQDVCVDHAIDASTVQDCVPEVEVAPDVLQSIQTSLAGQQHPNRKQYVLHGHLTPRVSGKGVLMQLQAPALGAARTQGVGNTCLPALRAHCAPSCIMRPALGTKTDL